MTTDRLPAATRAELADLLDDAAQHISTILTATYPTPPGRSYLHPVLGALSTGPQVIAALGDQLEALVAQPLPPTPAGLFALASYASALGWLTESLGDLTAAVERICTRVGIPQTLTTDAADDGPCEQDADDPSETLRAGDGGPFTALELAAIRAAADTAGLTATAYVEALSQALRAASQITDACTEICEGLLDDAEYVRGEAADHVRLGTGPGTLPTLVRTLLDRMNANQ